MEKIKKIDFAKSDFEIFFITQRLDDSSVRMENNARFLNLKRKIISTE